MLFKKGKGHCETRFYDQHFIVEGNQLKLKANVIDIILDSINKFFTRHLKWATAEAIEQLIGTGSEIKADMYGDPIEKRRFLREFYNSFPLFVRPVLYYIYRYFFRFGFLDGKEGLIFHFLLGFWSRFLVDAKIYEIEKKVKKENKSVEEMCNKMYNLRD
jgi:hypothetical protein